MSRLSTALVVSGLLCSAAPAVAQPPRLELPDPSPAASATQRVGLTDIAVTYHRPAVRGRDVWGVLVPYGQVWRAGANENTVLDLSSGATVGGRPVPAGAYGLHVIPEKGQWTVILSRESQAWGSFFYDEALDAARFTVAPSAAPFQEHLAYTFDDLGEKGVTLTLRWEKLAVPIRIEVDTPAIVTQSLHGQLHGLAGFFWQPHAQAATWVAQNGGDLERAETWAARAVSLTRNYQTLRAQSMVADRRGDAASAKRLRDEAFAMATEADINNYGYELLQGGQVDKAIEVFRKNVADHPASWNTYDSLGEALAVKGQKQEAIAQYRKALEMVGDETNKARIRAILAGLGASD